MTDALRIVPVESGRGKWARMFVDLPHRIYRGCPQWVPQFRSDIRVILARRHPYFQSSEAAFFLALRGDRPVGTIGALDDTVFNSWHKTKAGHFHFFDAYDDPEASHALFDAALSWMRGRGLTSVSGPIGFGFMGMGILVEGFEHRSAMNMMAYNHPYYGKLVEAEGFSRYKDQLSAYIDARTFQLPDKVRRVAEIALKRGSFTVPDFTSKKALARYAREIGRVYNEAFTSLGDDYLPMTEGEIDKVTKELLLVADPSLIKLLFYKGGAEAPGAQSRRGGGSLGRQRRARAPREAAIQELAGLVFGFADLSAAIQRSRGRITPISILDMLLEYRRTKWLIVNGAAILPKYQRLGGNALLYHQLHAIATKKRFLHVDAVQVAETTEMMLSDLTTLGARVYKRHRIYRRDL